MVSALSAHPGPARANRDWCRRMGFPERLRALMAERGISGRELARQVPCDRSYVSLLAQGKRRPSPATAERLDEILGGGGALAALAAEPVLPPIGVTPGTALDLIELTRLTECSDLGSGTVEALHLVTDRLCRDYPTVPARVLRERAGRHLRYVAGLLGQRATLRQHRELLVIAGWLAALVACVCYDTGDRTAAEVARRMTCQLGEEAGHSELVGWAFEIAAWFALVEGRFPETVALSETGLAHAGASNAGVQLTLQASRGYARMGDSRAAEMLAASQSMLRRLPEPEHPEHHFVFDRDKYEFYTATIYTWLGTDDAAAAENAREVVARCLGPDGAVRWPTRLSTTLINLGQIAGRRGDLDEAVGLGSAALRCGRRSAELMPRAAELGRALAARYPDERLVDEYSEILRTEALALPSRDAPAP
jgi:transcriptional regulator with XRE-family HTH domain